MTEADQSPPEDFGTRANVLNGELNLFHAALVFRVGELRRTGATAAERQQLNDTAELLRGIAETALAGVDVVVSADIPVKPEKAHEFDEERAYEVAKDFMETRAGGYIFTQRELREHLASHGVEISPVRLNYYFRNWRDELVAIHSEGGQKVRWFERTIGRTKQVCPSPG